MKIVLSIARSTIHSIIRNYVFLVIAVVVISGAFLIPFYIMGDGTALGQVQISLNYSIGFVGILLSFLTLWLSCLTVADDIETHKIHLILSKPVQPYQYLLGKLLSVVFLQIILLLPTLGLIYCITIQKSTASRFSQDEKDQVKREVLVGRRIFSSTSDRNDKSGINLLPGSLKTELEITDDPIKNALKPLEIRPYSERTWNFTRLPKYSSDQLIHLRYCFYVDSTNVRDRHLTSGIWWLLDPEDKKFYPIEQTSVSGVHHELAIYSRFIDPAGNLHIKYENRDKSMKSVIIEPNDTPKALTNVASFWENYLRMSLLLWIQLIFIAVIGCVAGAMFSIPMGIFISFSYIILGILIVALQFTFPENQTGYNVFTIFSEPATIIRLIVKFATVPLNEYSDIHRLVRGELIELSRILQVFLNLVILRGLPIGFIGVWKLKTRELGLVVKR